MKCTCQSHDCHPGCNCGHSGTNHRFTIRRITQYNRSCLQHGYMFRVNVAALLRYGD